MIKLRVQFRTKIKHWYKDCQRQIKPYALGNRTTMRNCMLNMVRFLYSEIHWALVAKLWLWDIINSQYVQWTMLMHMFQCFGSICDCHYYINLHDPDSTTISLLECDVWWNTKTKLKRHIRYIKPYQREERQSGTELERGLSTNQSRLPLFSLIWFYGQDVPFEWIRKLHL